MANKKPLSKICRNLIVGLLGWSILCIFAASGNYGFSRFYPAIPYITIAFVIIQTYFYTKKRIVLFGVFVLCCSLFNYTIFSNPVVFPILNGGQITAKEGDYFNSDGQIYSSSFLRDGKHKEEIRDVFFIEENTIFKVDKVSSVAYGVIGTRILLHSDGLIYNTNIGRVFSTNKPIVREFFDSFSTLPYSPLFLLFIF